MRFTDKQQAAIDVSQHNILVNAAAGSGKTAVLVERLFQQLKAGHTLDQFIVITFTKLAASEMKERLAKRLQSEISQLDTGSDLQNHLLHVESQIPTSHISTIDAFCSYIVREYGYTRPEITRKLSLIDSVEEKKTYTDAFLQLTERILQVPEYYEVAKEYVDIKDIDDQKLLKMLLTIIPEFSNVANHQQRYEQLLSSCKPIETVEELPLFSAFVKRQKTVAEGITTEELSRYQYNPKYEDDIIKIDEVLHQLTSTFNKVQTYTQLQSSLLDIKMPTKPRISSDEKDENLDALYNKERTNIKKQIESIMKIFSSDEKSEVAYINKARSEMQICIDMAYNFYLIAQKNRLEQGRVLFSDISQLAFQILSTKEVRESWREKTIEIMIDEYQDTTLAQEELFATFGADKLFLVGDMKQAIYRFRQSDPLLFATKNKMYREENMHTVIDLNKNFRSRSRVLKYINDTFKPLMDEQVGEMEYDENAQLYFGLDAYSGVDSEVDIILVDPLEESAIDPNQVQASAIAAEIQAIIAKGQEVFESGQTRAIRYSDIAILSRNNKSSFLDVLVETLQSAGIPFAKEGKSKFQEQLEVSQLLSMLKVISNPFDDVDLATVLKSPFGNMTMKELYEITQLEAPTLYEKVQLSENEKIKQFLEKYEYVRAELFQNAPTRIFKLVLRTFQFEKYLEAMNDATRRKQNIEIMYELTKEIETTGKIDYFSYVRYLVKQIEQDQITINTPLISDKQDAVIIQTFHKSKGLEYPVVFVTNMQKTFNLKADDSLYKLKEHGIVRNSTKINSSEKYQTIESVMFKDQIRHEALSEEMRLFYVALTRAREKLYLLGTLKKEHKRILEQQTNEILYKDRIAANTMLDWVLLTMPHTKEDVVMRTLNDVVPLELASEQMLQMKKGELSEAAKKSLEWNDQKRKYRDVPLKLSVSELKKQNETINDDALIKTSHSSDVVKPTLAPQQISKALIGSATHSLFEHFDFTKTTPDQIKEQIQILVERKQIRSDVAKHINVENISSFFGSEIGQELIQAKNIEREVPFRMLIDAKEAGYGDLNTDILVQGVIDVMIVDESKKQIHLIDYKTDQMHYYQTIGAKREQIEKRYATQAKLYKEAIERVYDKYIVKMSFVTLDDGEVYQYTDLGFVK